MAAMTAISDQAAQRDAGSIVVGKHCSGFEECLRGSVTPNVLCKVGWHVLLAP